MTEKNLIAYPGVVGSFSFLAAREVFKNENLMGFQSFAETIHAVKEGNCRYAILPVENSEAGRVADLHTLLPNSGLFIISEHYKRIEHHLLGIKDADLHSVKKVYSHPQALAQCSKVINEMKLIPVNYANTAIAAEEIAKLNDKTLGVIASKTAAETYNLKILKNNVENSCTNTTRFLILAQDIEIPPYDSKQIYITSLLFHLKNIPSALYKALGAFAENNINLTRIESCISINNPYSATFLVDIEAHSQNNNFKKAVSLLEDKVEKVKIIGIYKASEYRNQNKTMIK